MGLFSKSKTQFGAPDEVVLTGESFDLERVSRLLVKTQEVKSFGVTYEQIQARAEAESVPFNTALEAIHREKVNEAASVAS